MNIMIYSCMKRFLRRNFLEVLNIYNQLNSSPELVGNQLKSEEIKSKIIRILTGTKANFQIKGWDGFVGNISEETKRSFGRESKLNDLLK